MLATEDSKVDHKFSAYCAKFGKVYQDVDEYEKRKALYKETDKFIFEQNSMNTGYKLGHNAFSDLTKKERNNKLGLGHREPDEDLVEPHATLARALRVTDFPDKYLGLNKDSLAFNNAQFDQPNGSMMKLSGDPKKSKDWRDDGTITDVVDQGDCNSSWAFMSTEVVSSLNKIQGGNLDSLSAQ